MDVGFHPKTNLSLAKQEVTEESTATKPTNPDEESKSDIAHQVESASDQIETNFEHLNGRRHTLFIGLTLRF